MTNIKQMDETLEELPQEATPKFADLGISDSILQILKKLNLDTPTPIQRKTIPIAITGQDLIGIAQTGTGKTYAFGIPMLQRLGINKGQGLIIAPTRELALQIEESLKKLGQALGLRTAILIGGEALDRQLFQLRKKPHIIVATPGRLIDHLKRHTFKLDQIKTLVLDEADMMLDLGFAPQIQEILKQTPKERQTMIFSATMPATIVKIAATYMKLPVSIEVAPQGTTASQVDQEIFIINGEERLEHLLKILAQYTGSVLVFLRTKHSVKALTAKLQSLGHKAIEIHSNLSLNRRRAALQDFKSKKERILVATDVAARGLDVSGIELVVNYNLPDNSEDYVHRIGRTGRAGQTGKAITFATAHEQREIRDIEKLINKSIKRTEFVKFNNQFSAPITNKQKRRSFRGDSKRIEGGSRRPEQRSSRPMSSHMTNHRQAPSRAADTTRFTPFFITDVSPKPFKRAADRRGLSPLHKASRPERSSSHPASGANQPSSQHRFSHRGPAATR
ncbi:MAG: DEAD/DEAH box helicase [Patescibacteria group bacterium]|jgi:ATP-dependent RNA helicase RhlE